MENQELNLIKVDIKRTYPETPYFQSSEAQSALLRLLGSLSKHSSSAGYTQGMNNIMASLLFHSDEVIAFELAIRLLNDYHLKEVHMSRLPGLYYHCEIVGQLIQDMLPSLSSHFARYDIKPILFCQNWIICLFTQVIPLSRI